MGGLVELREGFVGGEGVPVVSGVGVVGVGGVVGGRDVVVEVGAVSRVVDEVEVSRHNRVGVGVNVFEDAGEFFALGSRVVDIGEIYSPNGKVLLFFGGQQEAGNAAGNGFRELMVGEGVQESVLDQNGKAARAGG